MKLRISLGAFGSMILGKKMSKSAKLFKSSRIPPGSVGFHKSELKAASNLHCSFGIGFSSVIH